MAIEKSPLESSMEDETPIEIELEQSLGEPDGSKTFLVQEDGSFLDADEFEEQSRIEFGENIAESLDESELNEIASELTSLFEEDLESRDDWFQTFTDLIDFWIDIVVQVILYEFLLFILDYSDLLLHFNKNDSEQKLRKALRPHL